MFNFLKRLFASSTPREHLEGFGLHVEQRDTPTTVNGTTVEFADNAATIGGIMLRDAERQKSGSYYFNDGVAPIKPKVDRGHGGAKIPTFTIPEHLQ
jgi:hypothetical protein